MDAQTQALTAANIKYLLALHELDADEGVRCVDVAQALDISRPSVHAMIKTLEGMKLVEKPRYGVVCFTAQGKLLADLYKECFEAVCLHFREMLPGKPDIKAAACVLLAEMPPDSIEAMCKDVTILKETPHNPTTKSLV